MVELKSTKPQVGHRTNSMNTSKSTIHSNFENAVAKKAGKKSSGMDQANSDLRSVNNIQQTHANERIWKGREHAPYQRV
jgi:hypothetical protein